MAEKAVQFHATKQLLLDTVISLFETTNPGAITSEQVLAKARVTTGSLYHHFEDFSDLLEQALCLEYEAFTNRTIDLLLMTNEQATTKKQLSEGIVEARLITHGPTYVRNRSLRAWAIAYATANDRMKQRLGEAQDRLNEKFIFFIESAKKNGWVKPELNSHEVAVFIQSYQFGQVIDDVALNKMNQENWLDLVDQVVKNLFLK